jgi:hypothetical protein
VTRIGSTNTLKIIKRRVPVGKPAGTKPAAKPSPPALPGESGRGAKSAQRRRREADVHMSSGIYDARGNHRCFT